MNLEKIKNKNMSKILIITLLLVVIVLMFIIIKNTINNNSIKKMDSSDKKNDEKDDSIYINEVAIEKINVNPDGINSHINVTGKITILFDEKIYLGVNVLGYCTDSDNNNYAMRGPSNGALFIYSGSTNLTLSEINDESLNMKDWNNVTIKYCKIDKIKAYYKDTKEIKEIKVNYEKKLD